MRFARRICRKPDVQALLAGRLSPRSAQIGTASLWRGSGACHHRRKPRRFLTDEEHARRIQRAVSYADIRSVINDMPDLSVVRTAMQTLGAPPHPPR